MTRTLLKNVAVPGYIHVVVQGINNEYIFKKSEYKRKYINILKKYIKEKKGISLIAYCVMNEHTHILMYITNVEVFSDIMRNINSVYGKYYNKKEKREGYVFKNRYNIQEIKNKKDLYNLISYIHNHPIRRNITSKIGEYQFSSYNLYKENKIDQNFVKIIFGTNRYNYVFDEINRTAESFRFIDIKKDRISSEEIRSFLERYMEKMEISYCDIKNNNFLIKKITNVLKEKYIISNLEISEMLGIGKNRITSIMKEKRR